MKLTLHRADYFNSDFDLEYRWYLKEADEVIAERYLEAVNKTLDLLLAQPGIGRRRKFQNPLLRDLRSLPLFRPFEVHLIFYRHTDTKLVAERIMHGARDLPRRLIEPPAELE